MRIAYGEALYEMHVEPTPRLVHELYLRGMRVIRQGLIYPEECQDMYRSNGMQMVDILTLAKFDAAEFLNRHKYLQVGGALVGPFVMDGMVQNREMSIWRPHVLKPVDTERL
jgi:hypothetical protein